MSYQKGSGLEGIPGVTKKPEPSSIKNKTSDKKKITKIKTKKASSKAATKQGRPKGDPVVTRSIRIKETIDQKLVKKQAETELSFNVLVNRALEEYLK